MIEVLLKNNCVVDTSLLSNFVFTGHAHLLRQLIAQPLLLTAAVLDPSEIASYYRSYKVKPRCELLKPLYEAERQSSELLYDSALPCIQLFAVALGSSWVPIELTEEEVVLARRFSSRSIWDKTKGIEARFKKRGLGPGEAEACAVAVTRGWTLLTDDQPAIELLKGLELPVAVIRTCQLLTHAVERELIACDQAMTLFNSEIVDRYGFNATRLRGAERLWLRCDPPRCVWEAA